MISGVTEWGFYVELDESMCEGLVPIRDLADDYYDFDEKNYCLIGRRHGVRYTLGDRVKVQVARADLDRKQLDFALIDDKGNPNKPIEVRNPGKTASLRNMAREIAWPRRKSPSLTVRNIKKDESRSQGRDSSKKRVKKG